MSGQERKMVLKRGGAHRKGGTLSRNAAKLHPANWVGIDAGPLLRFWSRGGKISKSVRKPSQEE